MKLQVTLDTVSVKAGIALLRDAAPHLDIIEVGTPLLLDEGMRAIQEVRQAFPQAQVLADTKIWHDGVRIAASAFARGADMVSVLGATTDPEIEELVDFAHGNGRLVVADLSGVRSLTQRAAELEDMGMRYLMVPSGLPARQRHDDGTDAFHRNTRAMGGTPLALVRNVMRGLSQGAEVAVVDNVTLANLDTVLAVAPSVLIVGRAILSADDPVAAAAEFRRRMDA